MQGVTRLLVAVVVLAVAFDYINGFHDTANAIATSVATRALHPRHAILMATAFNFIGAFAGTAVAKTIGSGLVQEETTTQIVVIASLLGAITWNLATWALGLPSSSSHALIGGLLGATIVASGLGALELGGIVGEVLIPMVVSPFLGFIGAFGLILAIYWVFRRVHRRPLARAFRRIQVVSAGFMAFSHGSNDAQKTMGIVTLALFAAGIISDVTSTSSWRTGSTSSAPRAGCWRWWRSSTGSTSGWRRSRCSRSEATRSTPRSPAGSTTRS